ncbi:PREDICTED: uncharacterized protein LOC105144347 [Acromyrmex echinatior]|uniref:uncharacterized protein LOC105144347 n=1 Tax=Acromyrmex echinatior TaxID=103372 RepID=UPI000580F9C5|nr:PREDICTED: uncharacterized protein LOC105144347 [Acromyrmex echinatior]
MLANATLIPFFLGIFTNVSNFDPEYVFEMNKVTITYKPQIETAGFSSSITCHPFQMDNLRCFVHDIKHVISTDQISEKSNRIKVGQWFEMKFTDTRGIQDVLIIEKRPKKLIKNFMKDIIHQFNIGPVGDIENVNNTHEFKKYDLMGEEKTPIGKCISTYLTQIGKYKMDGHKETNSSFQIGLLKDRFDQKDLYVYIKKYRNNCIYSSHFAHFLGKGKVTSYLHTITVRQNKLQMYTSLNGYRPIYSGGIAETFYFSQITDIQLINIIPQKTISFKDYNAIKFDY